MMHKWRKHIRGIVDELMNNAVKAKATKIDVSVAEKEQAIIINVKDNGIGMSKEKYAEVSKKLEQSRRVELEEYYGALAGESMIGTGLSLVGMMTDRAEIKTELGKGTEITVYIEKRG